MDTKNMTEAQIREALDYATQVCRSTASWCDPERISHMIRNLERDKEAIDHKIADIRIRQNDALLKLPAQKRKVQQLITAIESRKAEKQQAIINKIEKLEAELGKLSR